MKRRKKYSENNHEQRNALIQINNDAFINIALFKVLVDTVTPVHENRRGQRKLYV